MEDMGAALPEMPDLSHLSAEEREIIEQVFKRQRDEEAKEVQISVKASEELEEIDKQINEKKEASKRLVGTQDDAICQICRKTKFADGIGHKCFYCQLRSCARCGGRSQSKNKAIWACSLCQKRQQILARTGKWFQPEEQQQQQKLSGADLNSPMQPPSQKPSMDSAAQGVTQAMQQPQGQTGNMQQSGQPVQGRNGPQTGNMQGAGVQMQTTQQQQQRMNEQHSSQQTQQRREMMRKEGSVTGMGMQMQGQQRGQQMGQPQGPGMELTQAHLQRQKSLEQSQYNNAPSSSYGNGTIPNRRTSQQIPGQQQQQQQQQQQNMHQQNQQQRMQQTVDNRTNYDNSRQTDGWRGSDLSNDTRNQNTRYEQINQINDRNNSETVDGNRGDNRDKRRVTEDSYSSSQFNGTRQNKQGQGGAGSSEPVPPAVPVQSSQPPLISSTATTTAQQQPRKKTRLHRQLHSMSSSEEDPAPSTSLAPDDLPQRIPNECTSEKDLLRYIYAGEKTKPAKRGVGRGLLPNSLVSSPRHSSSPRLGPGPGPSNSPVIPGDMLAAKIRTYLSHPVTWQPSADQRRLIGHMVLSRTESSANGDLGLKVVGGRRVDTGRLGAFITQVRVGSAADTIGRLRAGDEVLEWNGQPLQNLTFDQVYEIIAASKNEGQVELIVSRSASIPGGDDFLNMHPVRQLPSAHTYLLDDYYSPSPSPLPVLPPAHSLTHSQSAMLPQLFAQQSSHSPRHKYLPALHYDAVSSHLPMHTAATTGGSGKGHIFGKIEISLLYIPEERKLCVRVEGAFDLPSRPDGVPRNVYAKLFLLPDRSERSRRQTAIVAESCSPQWGEVFYYKGITEYILVERVLEITVWDYDKYDTNTYLGEALVDLGRAELDGQIFACPLVDMDEESPLRYKLRYQKYSHLPQRPHSEMGGRYHHLPYEMLEEPYEYGRETIRRSRTYDRGRQAHRRGDTPLRNVEEDWTSGQSGYLSDHAYSQPTRGYKRRPRSATTMRPLTAAEMSASRMYRGMAENMWDEEPVGYAQPPPIPLSGGSMENYDRLGLGGIVTNGKLDEQQEHGSDASETVSIQSGGSIPVVRTVNRRIALDEMEEYPSQEDSSGGGGGMSRGGGGKGQQMQSAQQAMKERKKSLMTRFIPGRGAAGAEGKRTGFARSEEVGIPNTNGGGEPQRLQTNANAPFLKQASKESTDSQHSDNWLPVLPDGPLGTFVENLGPGQVVGRQVLASPVLGEIHLAIMAGRGGIDVEIIRARNLVVKPGSKISPAPYVKVYLMEGKQCIQKAKTAPAKKSTAPTFQQHLIFNESPKYKMLQITVLGDYGRMERKSFMGIAQIRLDDLQLGTEPVIGWYKLFHSSSLAGSGPVRKDSESSLSALQQQ